jgi:shikimate kinase
MNIVIFGMKNSGKSTLAKKLAHHYGMALVVIDAAIEKLHTEKKQETLSFRDINKKYGRDYFLALEAEVIHKLKDMDLKNTIIDCSGPAPLREENRKVLKTLGPSIWLRVDPEVNYARLMRNGIPAFFTYPDNPRKSFDELWQEREPIYRDFADYTIDATNETPDALLLKVKKTLNFEP